VTRNIDVGSNFVSLSFDYGLKCKRVFENNKYGETSEHIVINNNNMLAKISDVLIILWLQLSV